MEWIHFRMMLQLFSNDCQVYWQFKIQKTGTRMNEYVLCTVSIHYMAAIGIITVIQMKSQFREQIFQELSLPEPGLVTTGYEIEILS